MQPNPTINPIPDIVTCIHCLGWGTKFKEIATISNNKMEVELIICIDCEGTGRKPVPKSEII